MNAKKHTGSPVQVATKEIESANIITVTAGTNCPMGGDTGHGGRTILAIKNEASSDMRIELDGIDYGNIESVKLIFGGDCECRTVIEALEFSLETLKMQLKTNGKSKNIIICE